MSGPDEPGFIQARCPACDGDDVWLTCEGCGKSDHFRLAEQVRCRCGATYDHAVCTCGEPVPLAHLHFVPFEDGPLALADLEVDWRRVGVLLVVAGLLLVGGIAAWMA